MAMIGQGKTRGQVAVLHLDAATNQNAAAIDINDDHNKDYVYQQLLFRYDAIRNLSNSSGQQNLNLEIIRAITFPYFPIGEQTKIADLLMTWDQVTDNAERLIIAKGEKSKSLHYSLLTGKMRLNGYERPWTERPLGELFKERRESSCDHLPLLSITREDGVIHRNDSDKKDNSSEDKSKYLRICPGDIGYNTMRMWQGVSALSSLEGIVSPAYTICIPKEGVDGEFMSYYFKLPQVINLFYRHSQGLTSDTWNLKFRHFQEIKVTIPELNEQRAIARFLKCFNEEILILKKQADAYRRQKRGLMQKLLTGQWRVRTKNGG